MANKKSKGAKPRESAASPPASAAERTSKSSSAPATPVAPVAPGKVPPLFRKIDWLALAIAFGTVWLAYFLTLAPELTLEDSGELCTGAFYAGIPHPPGYPFWTIYSWFWTTILPVGNVAWRVEMGESFAAALACGLVAFMVSRGSSMLMEGIAGLQELTGKWENAICLVSGIVAGMLLGFGGVMWSESVAINRIALFGVPWVMIVMLCLMRWIYAPHQRRYLYCAMFFFGICATIHQTLIVAAMGIEFIVIYAQPKLGRDMLFGNSLIYLGMLYAKSQGWVPQLLQSLDNSIVAIFFHLIGVTSGIVCLVLVVRTKKLLTEIVPCLVMLVLYVLGVSFYFYEALAGMTDPPMQWGYPRTVEGFFHALSRGQYEKASPSDVFGDPMHFVTQLGMLAGDIAHEYNWLCVFIALVPLLFFFKMQRRERTWIGGIVAIYACIGVFLVILMNPSPDRQSADLIRVFFTSSHAVIALMIGYGMALTAAYMATHYRRFRIMALLLGIVALLPAAWTYYNRVSDTFYGGKGWIAPKSVILIFLLLAVSFVLTALAAQQLVARATAAPAEVGASPQRKNELIFGAIALVCLCLSALLIFYPKNSLSPGELAAALPRAFAPDRYSLPVLGGMLLFGISVAFIGGLAAYRQRAPLAISLGLFAALPLVSVMSHWGACEQRNHWFGYWFGHDMFTPPFVGPDRRLAYDATSRQQATKGPNGNLVYPKMARDAVLYGGTDPGRFCPTYMIFCESFIPHRCQPEQDQNFDRRDVYIITQNALADGTYLDYIRAQYNRSQQKDPPFFMNLLRSSREQKEDYETNLLARLAGRLLDQPFTALGARIEARRRREGVYPPKEIYIASDEDSRRCYQDYLADAQRRAMHDQQFPDEPRQIRPGEDVSFTPDGKVQISGQVAVMTINGLITKVMFEHNPTNEFYVEESLPLDWMYPHLTPYGIIMKINRQNIPEITEEICARDHQFWSVYSERLIGNWITYDTSVKDIVNFIEKVYLEKNFSGFKGDRKFVRDEQAQKAFSKLRSSIAGIYAWRLGMSGSPTPPQYLPKSEGERQRLLREADFAFKQAFAYCPFSPEAVFRYIQLLATQGRMEDAILVAETCQKLDPYNGQVSGLVEQLKGSRGRADAAQIQNQIAQLEKEVQQDPSNFQKTLDLAMLHVNLHQTDRAMQLLDQIENSPRADANVLFTVARVYAEYLKNIPKLETVMDKLVKLAPNEPEAWYNLAAVKAILGKQPESIQDLKQALDLSAKRLSQNKNAQDLRAALEKDPRFDSVKSTPEYKALLTR